MITNSQQSFHRQLTRLCVVAAAVGMAACSGVDQPASHGITSVSPTTAGATTSTVGTAGVEGNIDVPETPWWQMAQPRQPAAHPASSKRHKSPPINQTLTLSNDVLFMPDQASLTPSAGSQLQALLMIIQQHSGVQIRVAGYADKGNGGPEAVALALSEHRAQAVAHWLIARGVSAEAITTVGYGDTRPAAPDDTPEHRAENRRCEIRLTNK